MNVLQVCLVKADSGPRLTPAHICKKDLFGEAVVVWCEQTTQAVGGVKYTIGKRVEVKILANKETIFLGVNVSMAIPIAEQARTGILILEEEIEPCVDLYPSRNFMKIL
ncbi:hypothetical protein [Bradyrhizobium sp. Bra64]|uniref:hypothetical protein n=1 Tax=Bradyrhizobium sp. Bra64 TaxID=2926009 RepID=UPI0021183E2B|nr:hypothetical protein [Bradyrhizobium sp. Bra64]